jgi:hypothetical protein
VSYLLPAGTAPRTKNKWGLGVYGGRMMRSRGMGRWKLYQQSAGPGALGQDPTTFDPGDVLVPPIAQPIPATPAIPFLPSTQPVDTTMIPAPTVLQQPGVNPSIQAAYKNLLTTQQASQNPLDYVSPQAAIAAGLPAQSVYNAWSAAMARFPTQQAALNAGIPAGVVTQLWAQSRAAVPAASTNTFLGVPVTYLLGGGLAILVLAGMRKK